MSSRRSRSWRTYPITVTSARRLERGPPAAAGRQSTGRDGAVPRSPAFRPPNEPRHEAGPMQLGSGSGTTGRDRRRWPPSTPCGRVSPLLALVHRGPGRRHARDVPRRPREVVRREVRLGVLPRVESAGLAAIDGWRSVLARARRRGRFPGVDPAAFPVDVGSYVRCDSRFPQTIPAREPMFAPVPFDRSEPFVEKHGSDSSPTARRVTAADGVGEAVTVAPVGAKPLARRALNSPDGYRRSGARSPDSAG